MYSEFEDQYLRIQPFVLKERDAWRHGRWAETAFLVSFTTVERLANPARLLEVSHDMERLLKIERELLDRGLDEPFVLVVDGLGRIALKDGHHRLTCFMALGMTVAPIPCRLTVAERLRSHGIPISEVLGDLLT